MSNCYMISNRVVNGYRQTATAISLNARYSGDESYDHNNFLIVNAIINIR